MDLGGSYTIGRVIIDWSSDAGKIYDIQVSEDGASWDTVYRQQQGYAYEDANVELYATGRYVRVYGYTRVENGSGFSVYELEVYPYREGDAVVTHTIESLPEMQVVSAKNGKGSYVTEAMYLEKAKLPTYLAEGLSVPVESNDWWQSSLINRFGNLMSTLPLKAQYSTKGLALLTATEGWLPEMGETDVNVSVQSETVPDLYILPENLDFLTAYDQVSGYSDYGVDIDLCDKNGVAMTATFVKGSPYVFLELGDRRSVFLSGSSIQKLFDDNGKELFTEDAAYTADHIGIRVVDTDNRDKTETSESHYCVTVPEGTVFKKMGSYIKVTFPASGGYLSIGSMPDAESLHTFYQHGYAFVTDTSVTYAYDENVSSIAVDYRVETQVKREGFSAETIQCMLPHQWKKSSDDDGSIGIYTSVRGDLKAVTGNAFTTVETFEGLLPAFSMPGNGEFDSAKLLSYLYELEDATRSLTPAADAYWEGKNLHPLGMGALMADQMGETQLRDIFLERIKTILVNWFTYDGEDDVSYFIYDEHWGTLYYSQSEFGANTAICDHHFTYGYFMFAATVLASYDGEFLNDYKEMIELLIRDYANPSDSDSEFCRFRSYDLYEGHSWAGGYADNDSGNNQESASESLFSWVSLYLWGVLTENDTYRDAGIFGFTNEMDAVKQYWFDYDGDNWIADWPYEVVGQVYGGINFYGTFFGGQPLYIYGIQWLPVSEYLTYYGADQTRCAEIYSGLLKDTKEAMDKSATAARKEGKSEEEIQTMLNTYPQADTAWQHISWSFLSQTDPELALQKFEENAASVQKTDTANTYWFINSMIELGYRTDRIWAAGDVCASVYYNEESGKYTAVVWNPTNETKTVRFLTEAGEVGTADISAKALVDFEVFVNQSVTVTQVSAPVISVPSGAYDDTQYVEITAPTEGSTIYYTTDGTMPNRKSQIYDGVFAVSSDTTVKAIAVKEGSIDSPLSSSSIEIDGADISNTDNLAQGKTVETSSHENDNVDGSKLTDGQTDTRWSSGFTDDEWFVVDLGENYTINKVILEWEASYATAYNIQVSEDKESWITVYETQSGKGGDEEIILDAVSCRYVKMQGVKRALNYGYSLWEIGIYEAARAEMPVISPVSGTYQGKQQITMRSGTKGVEIRYTLDGSTPNENSLLYVPGVTLTQSATIRAVAYKKGMIASDVAVAAYEIEIPYANYTVKHYLQNTSLDGYDVKDAAQMQAVVGESVSVAANVYTGFTYDGGNSTASGSVSADGSLELSLYYNRDRYSVTYRDVVGATNSNATSYVYGVGLKLADAVKDGYTFDGWFTDKTYNEEITSISDASTGNMTLYAKWTKTEDTGSGDSGNTGNTGETGNGEGGSTGDIGSTPPLNGWYEENGAKYWYENGVRQGYDPGNEAYRGKEIWDPVSDAWYWLDNIQGGAVAVSKDVYQESEAGDWGDRIGADGKRYGKWVRYDENGGMIKGWDTTDEGTYFFDYTYGTMAKGFATIEGREYYFNPETGVLEYEIGEVPEFGWKTIDGKDYWYENYIRQGYSVDASYRGKEIHDPGTDAWYWLDNIQGGAKAVSKDVYQESLAGDWGDYTNENGERCGKWVRYDENGHMIKGWQTTDAGTYFFDYIYGTMAKGWANIDGVQYYFNPDTGIRQ